MGRVIFRRPTPQAASATSGLIRKRIERNYSISLYKLLEL